MTAVLTPNSVGHYKVGSGSTGSSSYANGLPSSLQKYNDTNNYSSSGSSGSVSPASRFLAGSVARDAAVDSSDYGDYIRQALEVSANNTAQSQAFAREQMEYQRQSDVTAMAWSANEAQKNRDYQERLSNTAHQREVNDLIAAGLNPILAANNGAYTGSGATGQAFSSSGAQGTVDTNASGILGNLANALLNTASQASIAKMYNDTSKYQADMQYAASKLQSETSIYNNHSNINANKILTQMNNQADIAKANISAGAVTSAAALAADATKYSADQHYNAAEFTANRNYAAQELKLEKDIGNNPVGYFFNTAGDLMDGAYNNVLQPVVDVGIGLGQFMAEAYENFKYRDSGGSGRSFD